MDQNAKETKHLHVNHSASQGLLPDSITHALALFEFTAPPSLDQLIGRYRQLLLAWHPHRVANLTNNPHKYMEMYKKGEAKTKELHRGFRLLKHWLDDQDR